MKKVWLCLLVLGFLGFVVAESFEISINLDIDNTDIGRDFVPSFSFWSTYGWHIVILLIVLIVVFIFLRMRNVKVSNRRVSRRKVKR